MIIILLHNIFYIPLDFWNKIEQIMAHLMLLPKFCPCVVTNEIFTNMSYYVGGFGIDII